MKEAVHAKVCAQPAQAQIFPSLCYFSSFSLDSRPLLLLAQTRQREKAN